MLLNRPPSGGTSPPGGRGSGFTFWWKVCAIGIAAVILLGTGRLLFYRNQDTNPAPAPAAPSAVVAACPELPPGPPLPAAGQRQQWVRVGKLDAPRDPAVGPVRGSGCFAPGASGALFAMVNWLATLTDPVAADSAIRDRTADSPGRDAMIAQLAQTSAADQATRSTPYVVAGYLVQDERPGELMVQLAGAVPGRATPIGITVTAVWDPDRRDWLIVPPDSGDLQRAVNLNLTSMSGYTPWSVTR